MGKKEQEDEKIYRIEDEPIIETTESDVVDPDNPKTPKKKL